MEMKEKKENKEKMEKTVVDARGLSCPQPVIETKKALGGKTSGAVEILVDTVTSRENVIRFAEHAGWQANWTEKNGGYSVIAEKK